MSATCLFIGGAKHPNYVRGAQAQEKQYCMVQSVQQDFGLMLHYFARSMFEVPHNIIVRGMLLNSDIAGTSSSTNRDMGRMFNNHWSRLLLPETTNSSYSDKNTVRREVRDFLEHSETENLILFMTGHGEQVLRPGEVGEESFLLPMPGGAASEHYTDKDLTEDIAQLPQGKKLYIICNSRHSGGMINLWELNYDRQWVVVFASTEAYIFDKTSCEWETANGFLENFCKAAEGGRMLCDIIGEINMGSSEHCIRPALICMRHEHLGARFLQ